jgi:spectinomycin phosphotransferase
MREDPGLDAAAIAACLREQYGIEVATVTYLPIGYDLGAAVYGVRASDGTPTFVKVRFGPVFEPGLDVPRALIDRGVPNILAPLRTRAGALWRALDVSAGHTVVVYPFIRGETAMEAGMSAAQWRAFGSTLRAVHDSGLGETFRDRLRVEDFALPSAALVREMLTVAETEAFASPAATRFAAFWREQAGRIQAMLTRAEALGMDLQAKAFDLVLCHADIHAANILVGDDGGITLIDWDGPMLAPRERDLLFVVGSVIARTVEPQEEAWFFAGYGPVEIDPDALVYYRYERIIEDIGEMGRSVFLDRERGEAARQEEVDLAMSFFAPGGDIDRAETVVIHR